MSLRLIEGIKKEKPDYFNIYNRIFTKCVKDAEFNGTPLGFVNLLDKKRIIYFGVKMLNFSRKNKGTTVELSLNSFTLSSVIKDVMSLLTPREFENIFPIDKTYDGDKFQILRVTIWS